jgi:hypothetical protein
MPMLAKTIIQLPRGGRAVINAVLPHRAEISAESRQTGW